VIHLKKIIFDSRNPEHREKILGYIRIAAQAIRRELPKRKAAAESDKTTA
jgi:hypothetical protein